MFRTSYLFGLVLLSVAASAQEPRNRPAIAVTPFDYGTVESNLPRDMKDRRGHDNTTMIARAVGVGVADLVVEKLLESERFRIYERRQLDAVQREQELDPGTDGVIEAARYIVTGSVSWLGVNTKDYGAAAGSGFGPVGRRSILGVLSAASVKHSTTSIHVSVRIVDTQTGEVIGSFTSQGQSKKRWDVSALHIGSGGFGGGTLGDTQFRETAIGEASLRVASDIAERMIALRATRLR